LAFAINCSPPPPGQLLLQRPIAVVALERAVAAHIRRQRHALLPDQVTQNAQVAQRAFLLDEVGAWEKLTRKAQLRLRRPSLITS